MKYVEIKNKNMTIKHHIEDSGRNSNKCSKDDDMFARTNEGDGYMQCQIHLRDSYKCERQRHLEESGIEKVAMNIVYQLDDDSGASVEFRQANNDKRIDFVKGLLLSSQFSLIEKIVEELVKKLEGSKNEYDEEETLDFTDIEKAVLKERYNCFNAGISIAIEYLNKLNKYENN